MKERKGNPQMPKTDVRGGARWDSQADLTVTLAFHARAAPSLHGGHRPVGRAAHSPDKDKKSWSCLSMSGRKVRKGPREKQKPPVAGGATS